MKNKEKNILKEFARKIVKKGISVPMIFFLESTKYISFVGSQTLIFFGPLITIFVNEKNFYSYIEILEKRENVEFLITEIETLQLANK